MRAKRHLSAKQLATRRNTRRWLTFQIFNADVTLRLDEHGRQLPCAACRMPARECALATSPICKACCSEFKSAREREREERGLSPINLGVFYLRDSPIISRREICARCREQEPAPESAVFCNSCLEDIVRRAEDGSKSLPVNLSLDFTPEPPAPWFNLRSKLRPFCPICGDWSKTWGVRCRKCFYKSRHGKRGPYKMKGHPRRVVEAVGLAGDYEVEKSRGKRRADHSWVVYDPSCLPTL